MYKYILFDLDGTITDPGEGITNSVAYALDKFNIKVSDKTSLYKFIGPPLIESFMEFYNFSKEDAIKATALYREYYKDKGIFECELYDYIDELLKKLKDSGYKVILATSKPQEFAERILEHFDILKYFYFVAGASMDESRNKKDQVIKYAIDNMPIEDVELSIMIGDRKHDVLGARVHGIKTIGITYGYGSREEFIENNAAYILNSPKEIEDFFIN